MIFEYQFRIARAIQRVLAQIQQTLQDLKESVDKQGKSAESYRHQQSKIDPNPVVRLPTEIPEYYRSEQGERAERIKREGIRIRLERIGVILAAAIAFLTFVTLIVFYKQLREARSQTFIFKQQAEQAKKDASSQLTVAKDALTAEQKRFVDDQRPYIWQSNAPIPAVPGPQPQMTPDQPVFWSYSYTNYGKTPAIGVKGREQVIWGHHAHSQLVKDFFSPIHKPNDKSGTVVAPNQGMFATAHTIKSNPTEADIEWIKANDRGIMMISYTEYFDTAGNLYKTTICLMRLQSGAVADCDTLATPKIE